MNNYDDSLLIRAPQFRSAIGYELLLAARAAVKEDFFIFPLKPWEKEPLAIYINPAGIETWANGKNSCLSSSNGAPRTYIHKRTGREYKTSHALQAWWDNLECNFAIAAELSGLCFVDIDKGLDSLEELTEFMRDFNLPMTRVIRSGRRTSFGAHLYYRGVVPSSVGQLSIPWRGKIVILEIKSRGDNMYVVGENSVHPTSKEKYTRAIDLPIAPTPSILCDLIGKYSLVKSIVIPVASGDSHAVNGDHVSKEDLETFFEDNGEDFTYVHFNETTKRLCWLRDDRCPWESAHEHKNNPADFMVMINTVTGKLEARCVHTSCRKEMSDPTSVWRSYRAWLDAQKGRHVLIGTGKIIIGKKKPQAKVFVGSPRFKVPTGTFTTDRGKL